MSVRYDRLWRMLESKKLSRTDLRNLTGMSTATLAKLSANEGVALSVLERICLVLNCQIEDITEIVSPKSNSRWKRITENKVYLVRMLFLSERHDKQVVSVRFLYGYSIACSEPTENGRAWNIKHIFNRGDLAVWSATLSITGKELLSLLNCMEQKERWGTFLEQNSFTLRNPSTKNRQWICHELPLVCLYPEGLYYRPEILLIPAIESAAIKERFQPIHSPDDDPLFCESFVSSNMQVLYCGENGQLLSERMDLIRDIFRQEGLLENGYKDFVRIGSFEVLSRMKEETRQEELYQIEPIMEEQSNPHGRVSGYQITLFHQHLKGDYFLEVHAYTADNLTASKTFFITVDDHDVIRQVDVAENYNMIELHLSKVDTNEQIDLIGYKRIAYVRNISATINAFHQHYRLVDYYTQKNRNANSQVERYTSNQFAVATDSTTPWKTQYDQVQKDFEQMYGHEPAETAYFSGESASHEEFLTWLKGKVSRSNVREVYLFDPYIDTDSIGRIIRLIGNTDIKYTIVTDACAPSREHGRMEKIGIACQGFSELIPRNVQILAFQSGDAILHDRYLLLTTDSYLPEVYNLSNSLDNVGRNKPSVACKLDRYVAGKVAEYYWGKLQELETTEKIKVIWSSSAQSRTVENVLAVHHVSLQEAIQPFNDVLQQNGLHAILIDQDHVQLWPKDVSEAQRIEVINLLCGMAAENWPEFAQLYDNTLDNHALFEAILSQHNDQLARTLSNVAQEILDDVQRVSAQPENRGIAVELNMSASDLFQWAACNLKHPDGYPSFCDKKIGMRLAMRVAIHRYFSLFESLLQQLFTIKTRIAFDRAIALLQLLTYEFYTMEKEQLELATHCLRSPLEPLVVIGMQWCIMHSEETPEILSFAAEELKDLERCQELFREAVINCQIRFLHAQRRLQPASNDILQAQMNQLKDQWAQWLPSTIDDMQMSSYFDALNYRNVEDTCDMLFLALENEKTSIEAVQSYLLRCLFQKLDRCIKHKEGFWNAEDIQKGEKFLNALISISNDAKIPVFLSMLAEKEKALVKSLRDVFLKARNYTMWKCYMDMLGWCMLMRLLCRDKISCYSELITEDTNLPARQREITSLFRKHQITLSQYSQMYAILQQYYQALQL